MRLCRARLSERKSRTTHVGGAGVRLEEASDADRVLLLLLDSDVHGLDAPEEQPRVERAQARALCVLEEVDLKIRNRATTQVDPAQQKNVAKGRG